MVKNPPAKVGHVASIPRVERSPEGGYDNPLQYSCRKNAMDRGAWWATVHGVAKSQTQLRDWACSVGMLEGIVPPPLITLGRHCCAVPDRDFSPHPSSSSSRLVPFYSEWESWWRPKVILLYDGLFFQIYTHLCIITTPKSSCSLSQSGSHQKISSSPVATITDLLFLFLNFVSVKSCSTLFCQASVIKHFWRSSTLLHLLVVCGFLVSLLCIILLY